MLLLVTLKRKKHLNNILGKTAFQGLDTEREPEPEPYQ
jgi:hypothetical protein